MEGGKVRGDLSLAHHHMFLCLPSLALGTDYHRTPATVTVHRSGLCPSTDPDWRTRRLSSSPHSSSVRPKPCLHLSDGKYTHISKFKEDFQMKCPSTKESWEPYLRSFSWICFTFVDHVLSTSFASYSWAGPAIKRPTLCSSALI